MQLLFYNITHLVVTENLISVLPSLRVLGRMDVEQFGVFNGWRKEEIKTGRGYLLSPMMVVCWNGA